MRISDWSSDVCSSDLETLDIVEIAGEKFAAIGRDQPPVGRYAGERLAIEIIALARFAREAIGLGFRTGAERAGDRQPRGDLRRVGEIEHAQRIIALGRGAVVGDAQHIIAGGDREHRIAADTIRSEEHTSELQSLMRISYALFC